VQRVTVLVEVERVRRHCQWVAGARERTEAGTHLNKKKHAFGVDPHACEWVKNKLELLLLLLLLLLRILLQLAL